MEYSSSPFCLFLFIEHSLLRVVEVDEQHWKAMSMLGNYDVSVKCVFFQ